MKEIPAASTWESQMMADLDFIRKHRRYPFTRMTIMPVLSSCALIFVCVRLMLMPVVMSFQYMNATMTVILLLLLTIPVIVMLRKHMAQVWFKSIATGRSKEENASLIEAFLQADRLRYTRINQNPGVFMIISRHIGGKTEKREVMIFIADTQRILLNSHFTSARKWYALPLAPTHQASIVRMLKKWLKEQFPAISPDTAVRKS